MTKNNYRRLGDFIQKVDARNTEHEDLPLVGLTIDKKFIPSVANTIGTDLSVYKIIAKNQFACSLMQVSRDGKIPIARYDKEKAIMSPAYPMFEVIDTNLLLPEYLMMWFTRSEFDRQAAYYAVGGVRGSLDWNDFIDLELPVPTIEKQREIVQEYQVVEKRIALNEQLIAKLEETAQAVYREWFVEFEFPDEDGKPYKSNGGKMVWNEELEKEVPEGWEVKEIGSVFETTIGRTPPRLEEKWFNGKENYIDWISIKDLANCGTYIFNTNENLSIDAVNKFSIPIIKSNTTIMSFKMSIGKIAITTKPMLSNEAIIHFNLKKKTELTSEFIYCFFSNFQFNKLGSTSSIVESINSAIIKEIDVIIPNYDTLNLFQQVVIHIFLSKRIKKEENQKLEELKALLLTRMVK